MSLLYLKKLFEIRRTGFWAWIRKEISVVDPRLPLPVAEISIGASSFSGHRHPSTLFQKGHGGQARGDQRRGQTLIETMVAVFMLVMGITAAVGLAIFALNSSSNITKQIIATGLAREGLEAVRAMRGTNWLKDSAVATCYNYKTGANDQNCYLNWLGDNNAGSGGAGSMPYCLNPTNNPGNCNGSGPNTENYNLGINSSDNGSSGSKPLWNLQLQHGTDNYGLNFDSNLSGDSFNGFYAPSNSLNGSADYYREIILSKDASAPFNQNEGPKLTVQSRVWWTDKKCPRTAIWPGAGKCSVELVTYLTNWKNY